MPISPDVQWAEACVWRYATVCTCKINSVLENRPWNLTPVIEGEVLTACLVCWWPGERDRERSVCAAIIARCTVCILWLFALTGLRTPRRRTYKHTRQQINSEQTMSLSRALTRWWRSLAQRVRSLSSCSNYTWKNETSTDDTQIHWWHYIMCMQTFFFTKAEYNDVCIMGSTSPWLPYGASLINIFCAHSVSPACCPQLLKRRSHSQVSLQFTHYLLTLMWVWFLVEY